LPEIVAIKNIEAEPFTEDNAYPMFLAINGPSAKNLNQVTTEIRTFLNLKIKQSGVDYLSEQEFDDLLGKDHDKSWLNTHHLCGSRTEKKCMEQIYRNLKGRPISNARLIKQITKYEKLIEFNDFKEGTQLKLDTPLIPYSALMGIKRIYLSDILINQPSDHYLGAATKDMRFWLMVMKKSHLLITNMVAIASIRDNISNFSVAIKNNHLSLFQLNKLQANIKPLGHGDTDLGKTFESELRYSMVWFDASTAKKIGSFFDNLFFQPHATHNTRYLHETKPLKKVAALSAAGFFRYIESDQKNQDFVSPVNWSPSMLYNPTGKFLVGYAMPPYTDYIARGHDLNGMINLLKLQIEITLKPNQPVKKVITHSQYNNPYTLKPMSYNKDTHSIYFQCMDKTSVCELDL